MCKGEYWKELGDLKKAIREAIKYCHNHGILKEYLKKHGRKVMSLLYAEWNNDRIKVTDTFSLLILAI